MKLFSNLIATAAALSILTGCGSAPKKSSDSAGPTYSRSQFEKKAANKTREELLVGEAEYISGHMLKVEGYGQYSYGYQRNFKFNPKKDYQKLTFESNTGNVENCDENLIYTEIPVLSLWQDNILISTTEPGHKKEVSEDDFPGEVDTGNYTISAFVGANARCRLTWTTLKIVDSAE